MDRKDKDFYKAKFQEFVNAIENDNKKISYITYEMNRLKIALWDEESQHADYDIILLEEE